MVQSLRVTVSGLNQGLAARNESEEFHLARPSNPRCALSARPAAQNVARCGGPGLCPDCSREAGLGNRKNRMTTIDHQQAVEAVQGAILGINVLTAERALTAATPHLRAAWEQEMAEKIRAKFLGPDFGRNPVNGQDSPDAALHAAYDEGLQTALTLWKAARNEEVQELR